MKRRLSLLASLLLIVLALNLSAQEQTNDICKGGGIAWQTCSAWQADLANACFVNYPGGGDGYQQCLDNSWDAYVSCMGMFGCPVKPRNS